MEQILCLLAAAIEQNFDKIVGLLRSGININCRDSRNTTAIHYLAVFAAEGELYHDAISILISLGANINARDISGKTPLHYVLSPDYAELAKESLKTLNEWTDEELDEMIDKRQIETLRILVKLGADVNSRCNHGGTSLTRAIQFGNVKGAETLVKLGVGVNSELTTNWSLPNFAVEVGNKQLLKCLDELGADMNSKYSTASPLHIALKTQKFDIIKVLVKNGAYVNKSRLDNITPIMQALVTKREEMVETLAQLGADINSKTSYSSVIHEIVKLSELDMLQILLKAIGQKMSTINLEQSQKMVTPLGMAVEDSDCRMAEILVKNGADVNVRYDAFCPTLFTAMRLGHADMVAELVRSGPGVNISHLRENTTALMRAVERACPRMLDLLLTHGGDVNLSYSQCQSPIQDAVRRGDTTQVKTLAKLGADLSVSRTEGIDLLHPALNMFSYTFNDEGHSMEIIKMLVQAGINLNIGKTYIVTLLHDAVKLGDIEMVHTLSELGMNMDLRKDEGIYPLYKATVEGLTEVIKYLVRNGANINQSLSVSIPPLHDAVQLGNVDMVSTLINCGAAKTAKRLKATALHIAINSRDKDTVKCLLECGADVNKMGILISPLHDAIENFDFRMVGTLLSLGVNGTKRMTSALHQSLQGNSFDITDTLLTYGADINSPSISFSCLKLNEDKRFYPLHAACQFGQIDRVRLLILEGGDVDKCDSDGKKPLEYLPLVNTVDYHVIKDLLASSEVLCEPRKETISVSECKNMKHLLCTPGIGDVKYITTPQSNEISNCAYTVLDTITTSNGGQLKAIGSASEGTKEGLPTEMDFMIAIQMEKDDKEKIIDKGNGYNKYKYISHTLMEVHPYISTRSDYETSLYETSLFQTGSRGFHNDIMIPILKAHATETQAHAKIITQKEKIDINRNDRKACSQVTLSWDDGNSFFLISVDLVPCLQVNNWPVGAITKTWLMDYAELRSHGYVLVPKPPHRRSNYAKEYTQHELQTLWKVSFPHLETKHMQHLEQRVKDVYTTAKCLRNPDVCRILIRIKGSLPRSVDKYITSYLLKMCFFENVEYFQDNDLSLEAMVCKVYQDLVVHLSEGFVPIFFLPKVNALGGGKQDAHKCVEVARIMARFVRALYLRDSGRDLDTTICEEDEEITVYQRKPTSVYKVQDIHGL